MKRLTLVIISAVIALVASNSAKARTTAAGAFANAPASVFPMLDRNARLDMIDYFASGSDTPTRNQLGGKSRITAMDSDAVTIEMTDATVYQLALLKAKNDTIVALIHTAKLPAEDSELTFYSLDWRPLDNSRQPYMPELKADEWLVSPSKASRELLAEKVPFMLAEYTYDSKTGLLTVNNRLNKFLSDDDWNLVKPIIVKQLTFVWNPQKAKFVKQR
ncbi:MAG: DUF3256 family protein [Muribaculum sp.]|nr:DUF3256 family protein [Muribaculaceae bacterium]MCM1080914.1 DUF3256 family protein [Muribaculum sp.]